MSARLSLPTPAAPRPPRRASRWARVIVGLALVLSPAAASAGKKGASETPEVEVVDDAPPVEGGGTEAVPLEDRPAVEPPMEGIWAWVARLEGEVLSDAAVEALAEKAEAELAEGRLADALGDPEVPADLYEDPEKAVTVDPLRLAEVDPDDFDIPIRTDREVQQWMRYFLGRGRRHFQRYLDRSSAYQPMMIAKLEAAGLPRDLIYLSMIESGYNPHAYSHAGAAGLWQFMPATGRMYDLRVDWWVDDRRDPVKSTDAAVAHLADLHRMFKGDWELAWCAYNAGPGRVRGAMRRAGSSDFWTLARGKHLPTETANYPPKLMAAAIISKNAERYGFTIKPAPPLEVDRVQLTSAAALEVLAGLAELDVEALKALNPGLRRTATPSDGYLLNLPAGVAAVFEQRLAEVPESERVQFTHHTVRRGDTLGKIAAQYGTSTGELVRVNNLRDANRIVVGTSLLIPTHGVPTIASSSSSTASATSSDSGGDGAADASEDSSSAQAPSGSDTTASSGGSGPRPSTTTYRVQRGDTLSAIAARYGVGTRELAGWNGLHDPSDIRVGQTLVIQRARWKQVEVKPGDSLGRIAQRQGCSVQDLRSWNSLEGDLIHPGQVLRVRR